MNTVGILCEFNPFHRGHERLFTRVRERFGAETAIVCVMSGNFVQRGDFAICRKHVRAEAALRGGADLVLALPLPYAISSAEGFARGGVEVLTATGIAATMVFGSECGDTAQLARAADALLDPAFPELLRGELSVGAISFAAARQRAAERTGKTDAFPTAPNDLLGTEYCKAIRLYSDCLTPLAIPREGAAHDGEAQNGIASASYLRERLTAGETADGYLPDAMARLFAEERQAGRAPVTMQSAERAILSHLRRLTAEELAPFDTGGEGLHFRFAKAAQTAVSLDGLLDAVKTKRYAHARLRRMLLAAYLGCPAEIPGGVPYLHVLGCSERGRALLHTMRSTARVPVVMKRADAARLGEAARRIFELEARADDLYALAYPDLHQASGGSAWTQNPVIV